MTTLEYMIGARRYLHRHPELSLEEHETSAWLRKQLEELGYKPVSIADTGVYADYMVSPEKPWLLFRADIDALPVTEETGLPFASENEGKMHACGHDGHTAMLLGAARAFQLGELTSRYNLRFAFQPAEEQFGGAKRMLDAGVMPEHAVGAFGFHIWPQVPYGRLGWRTGTLMASNDRFSIEIIGVGAHVAMQNHGRNALQAGAVMATEIPRITSRVLPPNRTALVFVGMLHAGNSYNIVADRCRLEGTVRAFATEDQDAIEKALRDLAAGIGTAYGTEVKVEYVHQYPPVQTSARDTAEINRIFAKEQLWEVPEPFMTGEDFAFFCQAASGGMLLLGCGKEDCPPLHSSRFTFDETLMETGLQAYGTLAEGNWEGKTHDSKTGAKC